ncbi:hypothetical protein N9K98_07240 [Luminiphilus sp.]|nr:hypothetical protein [Luminiphilus sp.]
MRWIVSGLLCAFFANASQGAIVRLRNAEVLTLLYDDENFGYCMAKVSPAPSSVSSDCKTDWVTFSCSGDYNPKSVGQTKYDLAQLAYVVGKRLDLKLETTELHNDFCFATRVDVIDP